MPPSGPPECDLYLRYYHDLLVRHDAALWEVRGIGTRHHNFARLLTECLRHPVTAVPDTLPILFEELETALRIEHGSRHLAILYQRLPRVMRYFYSPDARRDWVQYGVVKAKYIAFKDAPNGRTWNEFDQQMRSSPATDPSSQLVRQVKRAVLVRIVAIFVALLGVLVGVVNGLVNYFLK